MTATERSGGEPSSEGEHNAESSFHLVLWAFAQVVRPAWKRIDGRDEEGKLESKEWTSWAIGTDQPKQLQNVAENLLHVTFSRVHWCFNLW